MIGLARDRGHVGVEPDHGGGVPQREPAAVHQRGLRHQHGDAGVAEHEVQPLARIAGVERQIGAAGLEDAEQPDQHLRRALDAERHHGLRPDAEAAQMMRQLVGLARRARRRSAPGLDR